MANPDVVVSNPFDEESFGSGSGLWDGKTVTIISAKATLDPLTNGDGTPVIDAETGKQAIRNVLELIGIADDEEKERRETYSAGGLVPTADGSGFQRVDGTPGRFHKKCEVALLSSRIKEGGFDLGLLWDAANERQNVRALEGARFVFTATERLDKDGKVKKNKKGYTMQKFWPGKFVGFKAGVGQHKSGNGAAVSSELTSRAYEVITGIIAEAGGSISRAELVRQLGARLKGDADANKIITLTTKDDFHKAAPWTRTGTGFSLGA